MIDEHLKNLAKHYEEVDKKVLRDEKLAIATMIVAVFTVALFAVAVFIPAA